MHQYRRWWMVGVVGLIVFGFFGLYVTGIPEVVVGIGDTEELIGVSSLGGLLHPPGFPLLRLMIFGLSQIFSPSLTNGHALAAALAAISLGLLWILGREALNLVSLPTSTGVKMVVPFMGVLIIGFSTSYWFYGQVLEFVQLHILLSACLSWAMVRLLRANLLTNRFGLCVGILLGIGIAHHHLYVLLLPALGYSLLYNWSVHRVSLWRLILIPVGTLIGFGGSYLTLFIGLNTWQWSWVLDGPHSWLGYILREDFRGMNAETGLMLQSYLSSISFPAIERNVLFALSEYLPYTIGYWGLGLMGIGGWWWMKSAEKPIRIWILLMLLPFVVPGIYLLIPQAFDSRAYHLALFLNERMYLSGIVSVFLLILGGVAAIYTSIEDLKWNSILRIGLIIMLLLGPVLMHGVRLWSSIRLDDYEVVHTFLEALSDTDLDFPLYCFEDLSCFGLLYMSTVQGIIDAQRLHVVTPQITHEGLAGQQLMYPDNPLRILAPWADQTINGEGAILIDHPERYDALFGLQSLVHAEPMDLGIYTSCSVEDVSSDQGYGWLQPLMRQVRPYALSYHQEYFAERLFMSADMLMKIGKPRRAAKLIGIGLTLSDTHAPLSRLAQQLPYYRVDQDLVTARLCPEGSEWMALATVCEEENQQDCHLRYALWAMLSEPNSVETRLFYATTLLTYGYDALAKREFEYALKLEPGNQAALDGLRQTADTKLE